MRTIRTMNTIGGFSVIGMLKNCVALNKEKDVGLIQASSADKDDKDDEYDRGFFCLSFPNRNAQNLRCIKQRKGLCFIQPSSDDEDDQDENRIAPIAIKISVLKCNHPKQVHLLQPVCRFVSLFRRNRKSMHHRALRAKIGDLREA